MLQAPQLRHAFSELDFGEAEVLTFHAGVIKDAQGNDQNTLAMSVTSASHAFASPLLSSVVSNRSLTHSPCRTRVRIVPAATVDCVWMWS